MKNTARYPKPNNMARGFTRLELVTVVATLGILGATLLPALARDRDRDLRAFCRQRLGQLARAMAMYAVESRDFLPPNPDDGNTSPGFNWCGGQAGIGGGQEFNPDILRDPARALLAPYLGGDVTVYHCPSDPRLGRYQGTDPARRGLVVSAARTVSLNGAVGTNPYRSGAPVDGPWLDGSHSHVANKTWYCYGKTGDFAKPGPAQTLTFIEEDHLSINDGAFSFVGPHTPPAYQMIDWPATYHDMACAVAFADGHVEMHTWLDIRTRVFTAGSQAGNPDIAWLSQHVSALISP